MLRKEEVKQGDCFVNELAAMKSILAKFPDLTEIGFGGSSADRDAMLLPQSLDDFRRARAWLRAKPRTTHVNSSAGTCYGLKHLAEPEIGYSTNGTFIAAALAEGFKIKRCGHDSLNAWINISSRVRR